MSEWVHPDPDSPPPANTGDPQPEKPLLPPKLRPPPGTYVIQVPKDQVYRVPPPENARRNKKLLTNRRRRVRHCFCWFLSILATLILLFAVASGVLYLVFQPKSPKYSVESISVRGFNLSSPANLTLSPEFDVTIRARNPNKKIGIYYEDGSSVTVSYADVALSHGVLPSFYQGRRNVTVYQTALTGEGIRLSGSLVETLTAQRRRGEIPLVLDLKAPVKVKVGAVKTWKVTVKVGCDLTVDRLEEDSKIVSSTCKVKMGL